MSGGLPAWARNLRRPKENEPECVEQAELNREIRNWLDAHLLDGDQIKVDCCGQSLPYTEAEIVPLSVCVSLGVTDNGEFVTGWLTINTIVGPCCIDRYPIDRDSIERKKYTVEAIHRTLRELDGDGSSSAGDGERRTEGESVGREGGSGPEEASVPAGDS